MVSVLISDESILTTALTRCLFYQRASFRYQQGCTASFTKKQRDLSIPMPLLQSVCRPYLPKPYRTELNNTSPNLSAFAHLSRNAYFLFVDANLPSRPIPSLLLLIKPLDFIYYKILSVINIVMTVDFLFLPKTALLSINLFLNPLSSKLLIPPFADKKNSCTV